MAESKTPLLDQLEGGKWPSFVKDMKQAAEKKPMAADLLHQLELSYKDKIGHWKHGGHCRRQGLRLRGDRAILGPPRSVPECSGLSYHAGQPSHGMVLQNGCASPPLRCLGQARQRSDKHARLHGGYDPPGDDDGSHPALLRRSDRGGIRPRRFGLRPPDPKRLRGTGTLRMGLHRHSRYLLQPHHASSRTRSTVRCSPTNSRSRSSACPNDCVASIARSDLSVIGTWKGNIRSTRKKSQAYAASGLDIQKEVCRPLPDQVHGMGRQESSRSTMRTAPAACTAST